MPLTDKGEKIKSAMDKEYGSKKGDSVFYASQNAGKIKGTEGRSAPGVESRKKAFSEAVKAVVGVKNPKLVRVK